METFTGRQISVTVAFRVPLPVYQQVVGKAERDGAKLSQVLRQTLTRGLESETEHREPSEVQDD